MPLVSYCVHDITFVKMTTLIVVGKSQEQENVQRVESKN